MIVRSGVASVAHGATDALPPLEMWAGLECTINRVGSTYRDQLAMAGHYARPEDVERLARLGVAAVRWPVLWERHEGNEAAWRHTDRALETLRAHGVEPIIGLVHHGSGPRGTSLLDDAFPERLAAFATTVARRYPWARWFTPVNEPLTTARFAGLYGLWYPHARQDAAFIRALVVQVRATQHAMAAIRREIPGAALLVTEDLGYTHSTSALRYQAGFENERRWLTFDLLGGHVDRAHPLWNYLCRRAPVRRHLEEIGHAADDAGLRPAIHGVNHYLTSERFLDEELGAYPAGTHGGNGRHRYADVEAVRVLRDGPLGPQRLLMQAWRRYGTPLVVTEAHLACTREQQMRWLSDVWNAALGARSSGADVRAVTAWSAFGAFDWRSLLTQEEGAYESGLFDVRAPLPRETALAPMVKALARTGHYEHPALDATPWWTHPSRFVYPPRRGTTVREPVRPAGASAGTRGATPQPILVTGARGTLGSALLRLAAERGLSAIGLARRDLDITDAAAVRRWIGTVRPWAVINAAGWVRVDDAERESEACMRINADGAACLAAACADAGIPYVTFSSDLVFGDGHARPLLESDPVAPRNVYGHSKAAAESRVRAAHPDALVVRTSAFFGDWDDWNFVSRTLATVQAEGHALAPDDAIVSPTYVHELGHAALDLMMDGGRGVWHLANIGAVSWYDLARTAAGCAGLDPRRISRCASRDIGWTAPRPEYAALGTERGALLGPLDDALARYARSRAWERVAATFPSNRIASGKLPATEREEMPASPLSRT